MDILVTQEFLDFQVTQVNLAIQDIPVNLAFQDTLHIVVSVVIRLIQDYQDFLHTQDNLGTVDILETLHLVTLAIQDKVVIQLILEYPASQVIQVYQDTVLIQV